VYQTFASMVLYDTTTEGYVTPNRYFVSMQGRWLSPDPLAGNIFSPQSLNRYAYVTNNPASFIDPMGLSCSDPTDPTPCIQGGTTTITVNGGTPNTLAFAEYSDYYRQSMFKFHGLTLLPLPPTPPLSPDTPPAPKSQPPCANQTIPLDVPGYSPGTFRVSFDANGLLNGASVLVGDIPTSRNILGYQVSFSANTVLGLQYANPPAPQSISASSNNPVNVDLNWAASVTLSRITFEGSFHVNGNFRLLGIPLGSGIIENRLNENLSLVLAATDLSNFLRSKPVPCGENH
jgi:RHS repeat-associated protein